MSRIVSTIAGVITAGILAIGMLVAVAPSADASVVCRSGASCGRVCVTKSSATGVMVADYWDKWAKRGGHNWYAVAKGHCSDEKVHDADALRIYSGWHARTKLVARGKATRSRCYGPGDHKIPDYMHVTVTVIKGSRC